MATLHTIIKVFAVRGRHFNIVKNEEGFYLAIEDKYITNGKINTTLNGFEMNADKNLDSCLKGCKNKVDLEYYISQGYSKAEAFAKTFDIPMSSEVEKLFA